MYRIQWQALDIKSIKVDPLFEAWNPSDEHSVTVTVSEHIVSVIVSEPEQKILQLFEQLGVNVLSVATDRMDMDNADRVMEKIRRWNSGHDKKCKTI